VIITVKHALEVEKSEAHGGAGSRRLYIDDRESPSKRVQGMTHGWMPIGGMYDWHDHQDIEEIMYVIKGNGEVSDEEGTYTYQEGSVCVFPANTKHKITNTSDDVNEFIFVRIYV